MSGVVENKKKPKIEVTENGPYIVSDVPDIGYSNGDRLNVEDAVALCRCGASRSKPYCDGSHERIVFSGNKRSGERWNHSKIYEGRDIVVRFNPKICMHSAVCLNSLPEVFDLLREVWVDPDACDAGEIAKVIEQCPSGALTCSIREGEAPGHDPTPRIVIERSGPYNVSGDVELCGKSAAEPYVQYRYSLCRCGKSRNKPFCDASHIHIVRFGSESGRK